MLCPFCMFEYTVDAPCFCHSAVHISAQATAPPTLEMVSPAGEFNFAVLAHLDEAYAAPYLGA